MNRALVLALVLVTGLSLSAQQRPPRSRPLVLEGATLIDGTGRPPLADAVVVVEGTRITAVGTKGRVSYPANATVITLAGRTILPGLIDGHVHLQDWEVPMFLPFGITTIADIHNNTAWSVAQREALKSGRIKGPRLFVSGARVSGPLAAPTTDGGYVKDAAEARAYVRRNSEQHAARRGDALEVLPKRALHLVVRRHPVQRALQRLLLGLAGRDQVQARTGRLEDRGKLVEWRHEEQ